MVAIVLRGPYFNDAVNIELLKNAMWSCFLDMIITGDCDFSGINNSGIMKPGLNAIMGATGSGKSS